MGDLSKKIVSQRLKEATRDFVYEPNNCPNCGKDMGDGKGDPAANVQYGPGGVASCPHCHEELPDIAAGEEPARPDGMPDPHKHLDAPPEMRNKLPSRVTKGLPSRLKRPPEGGPMPDAKLDPFETAMALHTAYGNNNTDEISAYAQAILNGGLDPAQLLELGGSLMHMRRGGPVLGALVDALRGEPGEGPQE